MLQITDLRQLWISEEPIYKCFGEATVSELSTLLKQNGIGSIITYRTKETDSLLKKIMRKNKRYRDLHDKVGVRVVVHFKEQLKCADNLFVQHFGARICKREDMAIKLGEDTFGYQSIHYDISNFDSENEMFCEIQLRTICQHTWSEMSHALSYKTELNVPTNITREINALSAIFELADNQFQLIQSMIDKLPDRNPIRVLNYLEKQFYIYIGDYYDKELTMDFLAGLEKLYGDVNPIDVLVDFIDKNLSDIIKIVEQNKTNIFFSQPELFIILERLKNQKYNMALYWETLYPLEELEEIANVWGISIE